MTWPEAVRTMGKWYQMNVHKYKADAKTYGSCSLLGGSGVRWDCTGYIASCLQMFGVLPKGYWISSEMAANPHGDFAKKCSKGGFKIMQYSKSALQPYDIVAVFEGRGKGQQHHAEIFAGIENGKYKAWSWGNVHDGINGHSGLPCSFANYRYKLIYRHDGVSRDVPDINIQSLDFTTTGNTGGTYVINLENYIEPYPVHSEYDTYTGNGGNIFEKSENNAFSVGSLSMNALKNASINEFYSIDVSNNQNKHTRIYSTNDAKIVLDELKIPIDSSAFDSWANQYITTNDVSLWQQEINQMKENAKKQVQDSSKIETLNSSVNKK